MAELTAAAKELYEARGGDGASGADGAEGPSEEAGRNPGAAAESGPPTAGPRSGGGGGERRGPSPNRFRERSIRRLSSSLPEGWAAAVDPSSGRPYFVHDESGTCQWERPVGGGGDGRGEELAAGADGACPEEAGPAVEPTVGPSAAAAAATVVHERPSLSSARRPRPRPMAASEGGGR